MSKKKLLFLLVLVLSVGLLIAGCGSKPDPVQEPASNEDQVEEVVVENDVEEKEEVVEEVKEEPKEEEKKEEEPKEEPKKEAPVEQKQEPKVEEKAEEPKEEKPAAPTPPILNLKHASDGMYEDNCASCHAGGAIYPNPPSHDIDASTPNCTTCHTLNTP